MTGRNRSLAKPPETMPHYCNAVGHTVALKLADTFTGHDYVYRCPHTGSGMVSGICGSRCNPCGDYTHGFIILPTNVVTTPGALDVAAWAAARDLAPEIPFGGWLDTRTKPDDPDP